MTLADSAGAGSCSLPASTATTVVIAGLTLTNPSAGTYAASTFSVKTTSNTTAANPSAAVVIAAATCVSAISFAGTPQTGGARSNWTVNFTTSNTTGAALA